MLISARTLSSGPPSRIQDRKSPWDAIDPNARRRSDDGRRQGDPWRRPRLAELRAREAEERAISTTAALSYDTAAVRSGTVRPDSVIDAPFAALARTAEFWALLGAASPAIDPPDRGEAQERKTKEASSLDDLFTRAIALD